MDKASFKIEDYEGPLDLLLHLVAQHKMDLYHIRIYELIDQYLAFIGALGPDALEPTSEFIEMAARLVYMKSAALLPRREESEELERELTGQLVDYQLCKEAARKLRDMAEGINFFVREPLEIQLSGEYSTTHEPSALLAAYMSIMGKGARLTPPSTQAFEPIVTAPIVSVSSKIIYILRTMKRGAAHKINDFFASCRTRSEAVATFLGVLELIKAKRIAVADDGTVSAGAHRREGEKHEHENV